MCRRRNGVFIFLAGFLLISAACLAQEIFMRGRVVWPNGAPAAGFEVKLLQNNREVGMAFTNVDGLYAFFNIQAAGPDFVIVVSDRVRILKQQAARYDRPGTVVPDIQLE